MYDHIDVIDGLEHASAHVQDCVAELNTVSEMVGADDEHSPAVDDLLARANELRDGLETLRRAFEGS